ncbi:MAG: PP2C family serine/threonine-protein phosphatase [Sandaracinaceae bacterium]
MTVLWVVLVLGGAIALSAIAFVLMRRQDEAAAAEAPPRESRLSVAEGAAPRVSRAPSPRVSSTPGPSGPFRVSHAARTDPGRARKRNEDSLLEMPELDVYAVADGMGGYAGGEQASRLAVDAMREALTDADVADTEPDMPRFGAELAAAIRSANREVRARARADSTRKAMGTTVVAARVSPDEGRVYVAHVGDSRAYRLREGALEPLTVDHTLHTAGVRGPGAGKLSRAVGIFDDVDVEVSTVDARSGDRFLLCSDGLTKMVPESAIEAALAQGEPTEVADALVAAANERGGRDNVTVIVLAMVAASSP